MASKSILGRYKVYKAGTKKLVDWLVTSAGKCCDLKKLIKSLDCGLLAKASKKASKGKASLDIPSYELRTQELLKLAQAIAESDPRLEFPDNIIDILKDVIAGRQECADWYAAQALKDGSEVEKENKSHRYFIQILERVLNLLKGAALKRPKSKYIKSEKKYKSKSKRKAANHAVNDAMSNLFANLQIEEPSPSPLVLASPPPYESATPSAPKTFKLEKRG